MAPASFPPPLSLTYPQRTEHDLRDDESPSFSLGAPCGATFCAQVVAQAAFIAVLPYVPLTKALAACPGAGPRTAACFLAMRQALHCARLAANTAPLAQHWLRRVVGAARRVRLGLGGGNRGGNRGVVDGGVGGGGGGGNDGGGAARAGADQQAADLDMAADRERAWRPLQLMAVREALHAT